MSTPTFTRIKRSFVRGGPHTPIADVTGNSFTDTGLTNGVPVFYVASSVNDAGESPNSSEVSAVPTAIPPEPTTMKAYFSDNPDPNFKSCVVEELSAGVIVSKAEIIGDQNHGWKWQKGFPPGAGLTIDNLTITWQINGGEFNNNPNSSYTIHIIASNGFEGTAPIEVRPVTPPPAETVPIEQYNAVVLELEQANERIAELEQVVLIQQNEINILGAQRDEALAQVATLHTANAALTLANATLTSDLATTRAALATMTTSRNALVTWGKAAPGSVQKTTWWKGHPPW